MQTRIMPKISKNLTRRFFFMVLPQPRAQARQSLFRDLSLFLDLSFSGDQAGDRATRHLYFQVVGLNAKYQSIIIIHRNNGADDAARSEDDLAVFQALQHLLLVFSLALHRQKNEEVSNVEHEHNRQDAAHEAARGRGLKEQERRRQRNIHCENYMVMGQSVNNRTGYRSQQRRQAGLINLEVSPLRRIAWWYLQFATFSINPESSQAG